MADGNKNRITSKGGNAGFTLVEIVVVIAIVFTLAALLIPNLMRSRLSANESVAVTQLKEYSVAQVTFQTGKMGRAVVNSKAGDAGYCDNFRNLFYGVEVLNPDVNLALMNRAFGDAYARAPGSACAPTNGTPTSFASEAIPVQGYLFAEAKELIKNSGGDVNNFKTDFALLGVPIAARLTGDNAYWIGQEGTVWLSAANVHADYAVTIEIDTPSNPAAVSGKWIGF